LCGCAHYCFFIIKVYLAKIGGTFFFLFSVFCLLSVVLSVVLVIAPPRQSPPRAKTFLRHQKIKKQQKSQKKLLFHLFFQSLPHNH